MNRIASILYFIAALCIFITTWLLLPHQLDSGISRDTNDDITQVPDYQMRNYRYASVKAGRREMEVYSDTGLFFLDKQEAHGKKITAYLFDIKGDTTKIVGNEGVFNMNKQHLRLFGEVESTSPDGFVLQGPVADYFSDKRLLQAPEPVFGFNKDKNVRIWANRAESLLDSNTVQFLGDVRTEYDSKDQGLMRVQSDRAHLDRTGKFATYFDHVRVHEKQMDLSSGEASLFYSEKDKKKSSPVRYLVAKNEVVIRETETRYSQSQQAEFFSDTNSIVLNGFPSVFDGRDTITGDKLTMFRSTGVVEVTAANAAFSDHTKGEKKQARDKLSGEDMELVVDDKEKKK